jgi:hypothetical protein
MAIAASDLLSACKTARAAGADFPTIWTNVLKDDVLVLGPPRQGGDVDAPALEVRLLNGQSLVFRAGEFSLE